MICTRDFLKYSITVSIELGTGKNINVTPSTRPSSNFRVLGTSLGLNSFLLHVKND